MNEDTIDNIIDVFDTSYQKKKNEFYLKYKSVDKLVELSKQYVDSLDIDYFYKDIFKQYFRSHVKSMYRGDFERELLAIDLAQQEITEKYIAQNRFLWGGFGGAAGLIGGYLLTKSAFGATTLSLIGIFLGIYFADSTLKKTGLEKQLIIGTEKYEKLLRHNLYNAVL